MFNSKHIYDLRKINDGKHYVIICENNLKNRLKLKTFIDALRGMSFLGRGIWKNNNEQIGIWVYPHKFIYLKDTLCATNVPEFVKVFNLDFFKPNIESYKFKFVIIEKTINRTAQARWYK